MSGTGKRAVALLLPAGILLACWLLAQAARPSNRELWRRFEESKDAAVFDLLVLRGAFGEGDIPDLPSFLADQPAWRERVDRLYFRESQGLR